MRIYAIAPDAVAADQAPGRWDHKAFLGRYLIAWRAALEEDET